MRSTWKSAWPLLSLFCVLLASCAHRRTFREAELPRLEPQDSGVLIPVTLKTDNSPIAQAGCTLNVRKLGGIQDYPVEIPYGTETLFASLPADTYSVHSLKCGDRRWDLTPNELTPFASREGMIGLTEWLELRVTDDRSISVHHASRQEARRRLREVFERLETPVRARLASAYVSAPLGAKLLQEDGPMKADAATLLPSQEPMDPEKVGAPDLKPCYDSESKVNALWLGRVEIEAVFRGGACTEAEVKPTSHTFSTRFVECAKKAIQEFHPTEKRAFKYSFQL